MKYASLAVLAVLIALTAWFGARQYYGAADNVPASPDQLPKTADKGPLPADCAAFAPEECPSGCVVCPPCPECSSISCQSEEFCADMGIDRTWYDGVQAQIDSFAKCAAAGQPVMESFPRQCNYGDDVFYEDTHGVESKADLIRLTDIKPEDRISSPLVIRGEARGTWFFEASFPVVLTDWDGLIIAEGIAQAQGDWMTEEFVPFEATLEFAKPAYGERGALILQKDNPSGLPENDDALEITIYFE